MQKMCILGNILLLLTFSGLEKHSWANSVFFLHVYVELFNYQMNKYNIQITKIIENSNRSVTQNVV